MLTNLIKCALFNNYFFKINPRDGYMVLFRVSPMLTLTQRHINTYIKKGLLQNYFKNVFN